MRDRNNIQIKVGDKIYIPKPIEIVDGYLFQDCWIANVDSIETIKGKEFLYAHATDVKKVFKLKQEDFYEENKNICKAIIPEDNPEFFLNK